jgi:hypothetical protein
MSYNVFPCKCHPWEKRRDAIILTSSSSSAHHSPLLDIGLSSSRHLARSSATRIQHYFISWIIWARFLERYRKERENLPPRNAPAFRLTTTQITLNFQFNLFTDNVAGSFHLSFQWQNNSGFHLFYGRSPSRFN